MACNSSGGKGGGASVAKKVSDLNAILSNNGISVKIETTLTTDQELNFRTVLAEAVTDVGMKNINIVVNDSKIKNVQAAATFEHKSNTIYFRRKTIVLETEATEPFTGQFFATRTEYPGKNGALKAVVNHEYAHKLDYETKPQKSKKSPYSDPSFYENNWGISQKVSKAGQYRDMTTAYSSRNSFELVAEAFAIKNHRDFNKFPKEIQDKVNKYWGDWKKPDTKNL